MRFPFSDQFIYRSGVALFIHIDRCRCIDFYQYVRSLSSRSTDQTYETISGTVRRSATRRASASADTSFRRPRPRVPNCLMTRRLDAYGTTIRRPPPLSTHPRGRETVATKYTRFVPVLCQNSIVPPGSHSVKHFASSQGLSRKGCASNRGCQWRRAMKAHRSRGEQPYGRWRRGSAASGAQGLLGLALRARAHGRRRCNPHRPARASVPR